MSIHNRFKCAREYLGLSQREMGERISVSPRSWQEYELGKSFPGGKVLEALCGIGFNPTWLLIGEGPMLRPQGGEGTEIPLDGELYMQVTESVLRAVENYPRMPRADTLLELIRLIHDEVKEGEMRQEEIKKNVVRILKIAS